jgi:hypothetical protein
VAWLAPACNEAGWRFMCDKCSELDKKIDRYRRVTDAINDRRAVDGITQLIKEADAEKAKLHLEGE